MAKKTHIEQYVEDPQRMRQFQQERAILNVTVLIEKVMDQEGVTRAELAKRLGRSRGWVTQLLDGEANKTVGTIADILAVLGREFRPTAPRIHVGPTAVKELKKEGLAAQHGQWYPALDMNVRETQEYKSGKAKTGGR